MHRLTLRNETFFAARDRPKYQSIGIGSLTILAIVSYMLNFVTRCGVSSGRNVFCISK